MNKPEMKNDGLEATMLIPPAHVKQDLGHRLKT